MLEKTNYNLRKYSGCGGWASKVGPEVLERIVSKLPKQSNEKLIHGFENNEDAAVYEMDNDNYLVSTLDFFTPIHNDPYTFGQITAANALSDIFAMGGDVMYCLNILAFPKSMPESAVSEMLTGAIEKVNEAKGVVVGGHTIDDNDIKYGLSVTGKVKKSNLMTNDGAKENQKIILTKKIGTGIYTNELNSNDTTDCLDVVKSMTTLNMYAGKIMRKYNVTSCTDVTGFGMLGHLCEVVKASNISSDVYFDKVPLFDRTKELCMNNLNGGMKRNRKHFNEISFEGEADSELVKNILFDPQTSGGLLIFVSNGDAEMLLKELHENGIEEARIIGETKQISENHINVFK